MPVNPTQQDIVAFFKAHTDTTFNPRTVPRDRADYLHKLLTEYHSGECTQDRKKQILTCVLNEVFFLLVSNANKKGSHRVDFSDIVANMVESVIKAVENYKPERKALFTSFIYGYLKNALATSYTEAALIRNPKTIRTKTVLKMRKILNQHPTERESEALPAKEHIEAEEFLRKAAPEVLSAEDIGTYTPVMDAGLPTLATVTVSADVGMMHSEQVHLLGHILSSEHDLLSDREKVVIKHRFGVFGHERLTLEQVAVKFNTRGWRGTKEWVYQLEQNAKKKIGSYFIEKELAGVVV
jgi:DNA-directed RNA polymerase sigma subunit (sigma70/sigma32)